MLARELAVEGQVSRFLLREVVEHVCGVGFIRRSRDLHKSEELSHSIEPWWLQGVVESRSNREACVTSDNGVHVIFFFAC